MRKLFLSLSLISILTGCAAGYYENTRMDNFWYGSNKDKMLVKGKYLQTTSSFKLYINDELVIDDDRTTLSGDKDMQGTYQGIPVDASCEFKFANGKYTCIINIDNEYATTLNFPGVGLFWSSDG